MAKFTDYDDDLDYKDIRPGDITDIFEDDDTDLEIASTDDEEDYDDDEEVAEFDGEQEVTYSLEDLSDETEEESEYSEEDNDDDTTGIEEEFEMKDYSEEVIEINDPEAVAPPVPFLIEKDPTELINESKENDSNDEGVDPAEAYANKIEQDYYDSVLPKAATIGDSERERETRDELNTLFRHRLSGFYIQYSEDDLVNYITEFIDVGENRALFNEMFVMQYAKYSFGIDFSAPEALQHLWVFVAGMFADEIEYRKSQGEIEPEVIQESHSMNPNDILEDSYITELREYKKNQERSYAQDRLDRTVFQIADATDEENCSIFDDKRTLDKDFQESTFYKIHKEVMTSDRFADMSKVQARVTITEDTSYIPIIDYSTGIRVICIDTNDVDQYRLNPLIISKKIPFPFRDVRKPKTRILYSDDATNRPVAVISSLKKLVGYKFIKPRYKIKLSKNYVVAYTTEMKWIDMFEKGDPDSKQPENSPLNMAKPGNMAVGIIILEPKNTKDRRAIRRNQIAKDAGILERVSTEDYTVRLVLSARITKNDLRLRNPALPRQERYVEYLIMQYDEANPVIINDGLLTILTCIIKEHKANYAPGTPYAISFEFDRDGLLSPAIVSMLDERDGLEPVAGTRPNSYELDPQYILPPSRLKMDGVYDFERGRMDKRYFSPGGIQRRYDDALWRRYDLGTTDGRIQFIRSRGFDEFWRLKPIVFDVMPSSLFMLESSDMLRDIIKVSVTMLADRNSEDSEAMLFKQSQLNYKKSFGDSAAGKFQLFLVEALDSIVDIIAQNKRDT